MLASMLASSVESGHPETIPPDRLRPFDRRSEITTYTEGRSDSGEEKEFLPRVRH